MLGRGGDDEPRVDGDAVAADAGTRLEDVDARVMVGEVDEFPDIDVEVVGDHRQFVGERDVDVAVSVLGELGQLGRAGIGHEELALTEELVQIAGAFAGVAVERPDDAVVRPQLDHDATGKHAFGAVREVHRLRGPRLESEIRTRGEDRVGEELGGTGR